MNEFERVLRRKGLQLSYEVVLFDTSQVKDVVNGAQNHVNLGHHDYKDLFSLQRFLGSKNTLQEHKHSQERLS